MEKIQFRAIYGIAIEKSSCSAYVLQQRLLRKLREQKHILEETYQNRCREVWENIEDRVLIMQKEELEQSFDIVCKKGIVAFKEEMQNIINRNRYSNFSTYKK